MCLTPAPSVAVAVAVLQHLPRAEVEDLRGAILRGRAELRALGVEIHGTDLGRAHAPMAGRSCQISWEQKDGLSAFQLGDQGFWNILVHLDFGSTKFDNTGNKDTPRLC